jgi:hypothetical protein
MFDLHLSMELRRAISLFRSGPDADVDGSAGMLWYICEKMILYFCCRFIYCRGETKNKPIQGQKYMAYVSPNEHISALSALEQAMLQIKTNSGAPIWPGSHQTLVAVRDQITYGLRAQAAPLMRLLILALVGLLFVLVALVILTGRVEIGGPIMGGVLLIGFGAAQFGRQIE